MELQGIQKATVNHLHYQQKLMRLNSFLLDFNNILYDLRNATFLFYAAFEVAFPGTFAFKLQKQLFFSIYFDRVKRGIQM